MDVTYQMMDQMIQSAGVNKNPAPSAAKQNQGAEKGDFDRMVRQKRQQADGAQKSGGSAEKSQAPDKPAANDAQPEQAVTPEQYMMAAALMIQVQPETVEVQTVVEEAPVLEQGEVVEEIQAVAAPQAVEDFAPQVEQAPEAPQQRQEAAPEVREETVQSFEAPELRPEQTVRHDAPVQQVQVEEQTEEEQAPVEAAAQPTLVFGEQQAVPVRVSAGQSAPVPLENPDGMERLGQRIEEFLITGAEENRVEVTLSPASLGRVTVEITRGEDGVLHVLLSATTQRAASVLERGSAGLQHLLAAPNRPGVEVEVRTQQAQQPHQLFDPNAQQEQQQQQQQQREREDSRARHDSRDFLQRLRLGLVELD